MHISKILQKYNNFQPITVQLCGENESASDSRIDVAASRENCSHPVLNTICTLELEREWRRRRRKEGARKRVNQEGYRKVVGRFFRVVERIDCWGRDWPSWLFSARRNCREIYRTVFLPIGPRRSPRETIELRKRNDPAWQNRHGVCLRLLWCMICFV